MAYSAYFEKSTPPTVFSVIILVVYRFVIDILRMCIKKFNAEKIFIDKFKAFIT